MEGMELMEEGTQVGFDELNLEDAIAGGLLDFDGWISLISHVEKTYPDNIAKISLVYDSFLSEFPLCYGYWRKYANHNAHLCTIDKAIKVFEQAVQSATYSVGIWVDYCALGVLAYDDPQDVRRLFNRGLSFVGKDYLCHTLWDRHVEFEYSQQNWSSLAYIYLQCLKWPTKKLQLYYDRFKKLAATWEKELECQTKSCSEEQPITLLDCEITACRKDDEIFSIIKDLLGSSESLTRSIALQKYISTGEELYLGTRELNEKIYGFEMHIRRPYFHVKPLDACQLENWHHYLDFVEMHGDFDWAVKVYERCLIACANYPEFWMRYVEFMETKGGREIANFALDRATKVFLKRLPAIHHFNARYKEQIGDIASARAALLKCDADSDSVFVDKVIKQANMEKRLGNFVAAANIYKEALKSATKKKKKKLRALPTVYINYSRLKYMITGSAEAGRDILINGIKRFPHSKLLLEELINLTMLHGGSTHINVVDSIICNAISQKPDDYQGLSSRDREDISNLYLELIDFCGTIHDIRKAWIRHRNLFPCSLRITPASTEPLIKVVSKIQDIPASMPQYLLESSKSDHRSHQLLLTNQEPPLPENHHILAVQVSNDQLQPRKDNVNASERLQQEYPIVLEPSAEHVHEPCTTVGIQEKVPETSDMHDDHDLGIQMDPKQISLENLSLSIEINNDSPESAIKRCHAINGNPSISAKWLPEVQHQESSLQPYRQAEMIPQGDVGQSMHQESLETQQGVQAQCQPEAVITHGISSTTPPRPLQTVKQQGGASPSQFQHPIQPVPYSSEYMSQYPVQTFDQSGNMQNSQAYYQMWQYYYYQQQQQGLFQQQQYYQQQQQPPYPQEQLQQQYQHQLQMQQQYPQQLPPYQQHTQFLQQQQQLQQQSYQQQQLQPQTQQQPPYQTQHIPQQQVSQQIPQLPDPQLLQQLLQQQQWKQQQLENHGKNEKEQSQNHQQFQALTPPEGSPSADAGSPHPRELSPQTQ